MRLRLNSGTFGEFWGKLENKLGKLGKNGNFGEFGNFPQKFRKLWQRPVDPNTFNELLIVVISFNVVVPDTFNELLTVEKLFNVFVPDIHLMNY